MTSERQGMRCKYLIDTSALYPILISGIPFNADECAVSTLTEYEIGNVLWRENQQKKLKNPRRIATIFSEAIQPLRKIEIDSIADVLTSQCGNSSGRLRLEREPEILRLFHAFRSHRLLHKPSAIQKIHYMKST